MALLMPARAVGLGTSGMSHGVTDLLWHGLIQALLGGCWVLCQLVGIHV